MIQRIIDAANTVTLPGAIVLTALIVVGGVVVWKLIDTLL